VFPFPDTAVQLFNYLWKYSDSLRGLYEVPQAAEDEDGYDREAVRQVLADVQAQGRKILTETESKAVMASYGIPIVQTLTAQTPDEAVACAQKIGYPVVVKLNSETITHKSDVGGVRSEPQQRGRSAYCL
jgi:acetyltransferase